MKVLSKDKIKEEKLDEYVKTEKNILSQVNHPFIVNLNCTF